ncbi:hypothetical protein VI817_007836 [Penicillium citrinum]|nr:hypothetical protein VI817_007836 [Penicillium citrinum]
MTPKQMAQFYCNERHQILFAYSQNGTVLCVLFRVFVAQRIPLCLRTSSMLHHLEQISQMCADAGVKLIYLPPYSLDLNLIKKFFTELERFIRPPFSDGVLIRLGEEKKVLEAISGTEV